MMKLEKTYIYKGGKAWFVSTINRGDSSALGGGAIYAETMAWEINPETYDRLKMVKQGEAAKDCLSTHDQIVKELRA